jgi:hypothetical protein
MDLLPISALQHLLYWERQCALFLRTEPGSWIKAGQSILAFQAAASTRTDSSEAGKNNDPVHLGTCAAANRGF